INTSTTYLPIQFIAGVAEDVELGNDGGLQVSTNRGYDLKEIKVNETIVYGNYVASSEIPDGAVVAITLEKLQPKHVTFTVDNPAAVYLYNASNYSYLNFDETGRMEVDLEPNAYINVNTNAGFEIVSIMIDGVPYTNGTGISATSMNDNGTVAITTKEKEATVFYIVADPSLVSVTVDYTDVYNASNFDDGKWTIRTSNPYSTMSVNAIDEYVITSIKRVVEEGDDEELLNPYTMYTQSVSQYLGSFPTGTTLIISAAKLSELRSAHVSLEVIEGTADQISVRRGNEEVPAADFADIAVIPGADQLFITPAVYGKAIYKVTVNDEVQTPEGTTYIISDLKDGDAIKVWPNFPDNVEVPLNISFTNQGTSGALSLTVDGLIVAPEEWQAADYKVKLGSKLGFTINSSKYNVTSVTINGQYQSPYGFELIVINEEPLNVVITAEKLRDYQVTVYFEPGTVKIFRSYDESEPVTMPDDADEVTFDVSPANNQLYFRAAEGYIISSIVDSNGNTYSSSVYVSSDMTLTVYTDKIERDRVCALYLAPSSSTWYYSQVTLSPGNDARKEIPLSTGYTFFEYGAFDCPFQLGFYPEADVYVNGTIAESVYGDYPALNDLVTGSVIKVYSAGTDVPTYSLSVSNASDGAVAIMADYMKAIESSTAEVLGTTDIEFVAGAADASVDLASYIIKVNGEKVSPDSDGRYIVTIESDSTISIDEDELTSLDEIVNEAEDAVIYNLQGIRVDNPTKGIYIVNGKKVKF
ncbi:MAG: hypothetical protein K2K94_01515, partial [Muribaculaceae bacterium]|nr:hypothetical protein [Muribaculaceae bacterium]